MPSSRTPVLSPGRASSGRPGTSSAGTGDLEERWTVVAGRPVFARVAADRAPAEAPPFVLVHGFAISGRSLLPTARLLALDYPTYVPDLPGFGRSPKPDHVLSITELADVLAAWMAAVGIAQAVLLGNSMGCQIVAELAHRHPHLLARAILTAPTGDPTARGLPRQVWQVVRDAFQEPLPLVGIAVTDYLRFGVRRAFHLLRAMNRHPMLDRLQSLPVPALLLVGNHDPVLPEERAAWLCALLPRGRLVVVPEAGHAVTYAAPEAVARAVRAFMAEEPFRSPLVAAAERDRA